MTDENMTPDPQSTDEGTQDPAQQVPGNSGTIPEGYVEKARFDGLMKKVQDLTAELKNANANIQTKSSVAEQLQTELDALTAQGAATAGEHTEKLKELQSQITDLDQVRLAHESMQLKLKVAKEMGRPDLMQLADRIPDSLDEGVITETFNDFASFTDGAVKSREAQLMAGITPGAGPSTNVTPSLPTTRQGWQEYIDGFPLGSKEREQAITAFGQAAKDKS